MIVSELIDTAEHHFRDPDGHWIDRDEWLTILRRTLRKVQTAHRFRWLRTSTDLSYVAGDTAKALPTNIGNVHSVVNTSDADPYLLTPLHDIERLKLRYPDEADTQERDKRPTIYNVYGGELLIRPVPEVAVTIEVTYTRDLAQVADENVDLSTHGIPDQYHDELIEGMLAEGFLLDGNTRRSTAHREQFTDLVNRMIREDVREKHSQHVPFPSPTPL